MLISFSFTKDTTVRLLSHNSDGILSYLGMIYLAVQCRFNSGLIIERLLL